MKSQNVEVIGGPFDGEVLLHQYSPPQPPLFFLTLTNPPTGNNFEYRMCVDGKFRLLDGADKFDSDERLKVKKTSKKPKKRERRDQHGGSR